MSKEALNSGIVDRIMGVVDENIDAYYSHGSRDFVVSEVSSIIASVLGENDAEIARLKASRQVMLTDEQLLAAYYSIDGRENASRTGIREERLRAVQAAILDANKFSR